MYPRFLFIISPIKGDSVLQAERDDWNVSYELGDTWKNARKIKLKNSYFVQRLIYWLYPEFSFRT